MPLVWLFETRHSWCTADEGQAKTTFARRTARDCALPTEGPGFEPGRPFTRPNAFQGSRTSSRIARDVGHITQICVSKQDRGIGLGYELLRHSLCALRAAGCRAATLTVTSSNRDAIRLYEQMGFRTLRIFSAFVWQGF